MGRFWRAFLASFCLMRNDFWEGCGWCQLAVPVGLRRDSVFSCFAILRSRWIFSSSIESLWSFIPSNYWAADPILGDATGFVVHFRYANR
jgi:hypothetical protein